MPHPLEQKIAALRRRTRCVVTLYGLSAAVAAVLGVVIVLGLADYCLRFQDRGLRIIASLLVLGSLGWAVYRYRCFARKTRLRDIDLALRVERRFPALDDSLLSSVEFLRQSEDDPVAGSAALRRAVIAQTTAESERLDFSQVLDLRPPVQAALLLAAVCLATCLLVILDPLASRTAAARLINPLGDTRWPQETHLAIRQPVERVARGQAFEVEVIDTRGVRLPPDIRIHYRCEGPEGTVTEESQRMQFADAAMVARRENILRPFSYRIEGGDDRSMPWMDVDVVDPPAVELLDIRLIPPAYTGWPPESSGKHIRAIVGTRIKMTGRATRPLESATLRLEGGKEFHAQVSDDGYEFTLPGLGNPTIAVEKSCPYWFDLVDREELHGGSDDRWDIRAVADAPPTITIEQPTSNLFVAPQAVVPLRVSAKDDLALRRIGLAFTRSQPTGEKLKEKPDEKLLPLYAGPEKPTARSAAKGASGDGAAAEGERRVVEYRWDLGPLKLTPGTQLNFWATASDYLPQIGKSEPRQLIVVTPQELQDRIAGRQQLILTELQRALKMQRASRAQVESLQIRSAEVGRIEQADVDRFQAAQLSQREVTQLLTSRGEGLPMHIFALLAELENNRIESGDASRWMRDLLAEIEQLDREHLTAIGRELTAAAKTAQIELQEQTRPSQDKTSVMASLATAGQHQDKAIAALERMLGHLSRWDNYRRFHREIGQLLRDQEELAGRTAGVGRRTLTQELRDLAPQDSADLKIIAGRQFELARQLDRILQEMDQAGGELRQSDPPAAKTVADALDEARRQSIGGQMHTTAAQVEQNQIGQSMAGQKQIGQDLQKLLDFLGNRRQHELDRLEDSLKHLRRQQQNALDETMRLHAMKQSQGELTREQALALRDLVRFERSLQTESARLGKQLAGASVFGMSLTAAAGDMGRAAVLLDRRETGDDTQGAEQDALRRLDMLLDAIKLEEPTAESDGGSGNQGNQQGPRPATGIKSLAELKLLKLLQQEVNLRTEKLQQTIGPDSKLNDQQRLQFQSLAEEQGLLADLLLKLLPSTQQKTEDEAANLLLSIAQQMRDVRARINQADGGNSTQRLQQQIVAELDQLIQQARKAAKQGKPGTSQQQISQRTPIGQTPKPGTGGQNPNNKPSTDNTKRPLDGGQVRKPDIEQVRSIMKQLWGELPGQAREQMLQSPVEEFPPKYELLIEEYFRRLSQQKPGER